MRLGDLEPIYRELKAEDAGRILLFRRGPFYAALDDDAREVQRLTAGHPLMLWLDPSGRRAAKFGAARLGAVLGLIEAAGKVAAVLERATERPRGAAVERVVLPVDPVRHDHLRRIVYGGAILPEV